MAKWTAFPHDDAPYVFDTAALKKQWARLHAGDAEPLPKDAKVLAAWALFHAGEFQKADDAGLKAGGAGITVANKAQSIYANYLEKSEKTRLAMFLEVAERAEAQQRRGAEEPERLVLAGLCAGPLQPGHQRGQGAGAGPGRQGEDGAGDGHQAAAAHADAHIALGAFHAEVIDKVGSLLGRTQGASKDQGLLMYKTALKLNPASAIAMVEYANGLVMLEGDKKMKEAEKLYADAAAFDPADAMERLDVEMAKAELED